MATKRKMSAMRPDEGTRGGFTIIEVVLVLAIAGLIFLMVFIALPALQRAQRDSQRKQDVSKVSSAIMNYQSNNNGKLPTAGVAEPPEENGDEGAWPGGCGEKTSVTANSSCNLIRTYLNNVNATENEFKDPNGNSYGIKIFNGLANYENSIPTTYDRTMYVITGVKCKNDGAGGVEAVNNKRDYAITFMTEGSGLYCMNSGS